jgi:hypothetical protein
VILYSFKTEFLTQAIIVMTLIAAVIEYLVQFKIYSVALVIFALNELNSLWTVINYYLQVALFHSNFSKSYSKVTSHDHLINFLIKFYVGCEFYPFHHYCFKVGI